MANQDKQGVDKTMLIERGKIILRESGFLSYDYVLSLQGPTFVFTVEGKKKLSEELRTRLESIGLLVI